MVNLANKCASLYAQYIQDVSNILLVFCLGHPSISCIKQFIFLHFIQEIIIKYAQCRSMCLTYMVTEVNQADLDLRGHEEMMCSEAGGLMDYEEDRARPKR